uniref:Transglutaminase elicitor n=1 Tax=Hyaloperonospora arabidopsidis (strain Emoy2) TaxID=559515 RepID=M4BQC2_HYAAE
MAVQLKQTTATSLYYSPVTTANTTDEISSKFPARGAEVADEDCSITVEVDPTLPDISTILTVPVIYTDLLANMTTAPTEPLSTKVGIAVLSEAIPTVEADQDAYTTTTDTTSNVSSKTGLPTTITTAQAIEDELNCATGWGDSSRKLQGKSEIKRRLEAHTNKDIAKLEAHFGTPMITKLADLPTSAVHATSPWPGPYWPTYQDSINAIWSHGQPSAAEKYAKAFRLNVQDFMNKVSADNGVDSMSSRVKCSSPNDCSSRSDGSVCAKRAGMQSGYCVPTWFGICHAWAPAATIEDEPRCAVTHNGVTFQPIDIKALISTVYDGASVPAVFTGTRFNGGHDSEDKYGRHSNDAYRDLNPAFFHIVTTNMLGKLKQTFVVDVTAGTEVWNQPVRGFKVYEQTNMSLEEAAKTFYGLGAYPWNAATKSIVYIKMRLSWIFETYDNGGLVSSGQVNKFTTGAYYTYILELDNNGVIIGGEWVYDSDSNHPDFIWFPKSKPAANSVTSTGLKYADVSMLLKRSVACSGTPSGSESATLFDDATSAPLLNSTLDSSRTGPTSLPQVNLTESAPSARLSALSSVSAAIVDPLVEPPVPVDTHVSM